VPPHKRRDITRAYRGDRRPDVLAHELTKKSHVRLHRRRTQPALGTQVVLIPPFQLRERGVVHDHHRRAADAVCPKVCEQPVQRRATAALSPPTRGLIEKRVDHTLVHIDKRYMVVRDPTIEGPNQRPLISDRRPSVPQADQLLDEGIEVWPNRSSAYAVTRWGSFDNVASHVFPLSGENADRKKTLGLCRLRKRVA
jgi:hypothetical protein